MQMPRRDYNELQLPYLTARRRARHHPFIARSGRYDGLLRHVMASSSISRCEIGSGRASPAPLLSFPFHHVVFLVLGSPEDWYPSGKAVTVLLAPRTARAIDLATGERCACR